MYMTLNEKLVLFSPSLGVEGLSRVFPLPRGDNTIGLRLIYFRADGTNLVMINILEESDDAENWTLAFRLDNVPEVGVVGATVGGLEPSSIDSTSDSARPTSTRPPASSPPRLDTTCLRPIYYNE